MLPQALPFLQFFAAGDAEHSLFFAMQELPQGFPFLHSFAKAVEPVDTKTAIRLQTKIIFFILYSVYWVLKQNLLQDQKNGRSSGPCLNALRKFGCFIIGFSTSARL